MNRADFIQAIFDFFRVDNEDLQRTYDLALTVNYVIDWNSLYYHVIKNTEKRLLPMPKVFLDMLPSYRIYERETGKSDGYVIVLDLMNGTRYTFEVRADANTTLKDVKERFKGQIKNFKKYPRGTVIMGDKAFIPAINEKGEECYIQKNVKDIS